MPRVGKIDRSPIPAGRGLAGYVNDIKLIKKIIQSNTSSKYSNNRHTWALRVLYISQFRAVPF